MFNTKTQRTIRDNLIVADEIVFKQDGKTIICSRSAYRNRHYTLGRFCCAMARDQPHPD